jgi:hypothetical protein
MCVRMISAVGAGRHLRFDVFQPAVEMFRHSYPAWLDIAAVLQF